MRNFLAFGQAAQQAAHDFAGASLGQVLAKANVLGLGNRANFFGNVIAQLFGNGLAFVACGQGALEHHKRTDGFASGFIGTTHHSRFGHQLGATDQGRFNFHGAHSVT